eukprot:GILI01025497.1.p1 GENE.GILI01025497.1~~GILI01025497.1.p1  ORF type:complete len:689 (-),score=176.27 GILI01025497.1:88-1914(-)
MEKWHLENNSQQVLSTVKESSKVEVSVRSKLQLRRTACRFLLRKTWLCFGQWRRHTSELVRRELSQSGANLQVLLGAERQRVEEEQTKRSLLEWEVEQLQGQLQKSSRSAIERWRQVSKLSSKMQEKNSRDFLHQVFSSWADAAQQSRQAAKTLAALRRRFVTRRVHKHWHSQVVRICLGERQWQSLSVFFAHRLHFSQQQCFARWAKQSWALQQQELKGVLEGEVVVRERKEQELKQLGAHMTNMAKENGALADKAREMRLLEEYVRHVYGQFNQTLTHSAKWLRLKHTRSFLGNILHAWRGQIRDLERLKLCEKQLKCLSSLSSVRLVFVSWSRHLQKKKLLAQRQREFTALTHSRRLRVSWWHWLRVLSLQAAVSSINSELSHTLLKSRVVRSWRLLAERSKIHRVNQLRIAAEEDARSVAKLRLVEQQRVLEQEDSMQNLKLELALVRRHLATCTSVLLKLGTIEERNLLPDTLSGKSNAPTLPSSEVLGPEREKFGPATANLISKATARTIITGLFSDAETHELKRIVWSNAASQAEMEVARLKAELEAAQAKLRKEAAARKKLAVESEKKKLNSVIPGLPLTPTLSAHLLSYSSSPRTPSRA